MRGIKDIGCTSLYFISSLNNKANGNLTQDLNKEIINISYNELNLPEIIDFKNNNRIEYQYDALGNKKRQLVTEGGKLVKTTDFIGNFVYENNYPVYNTFDEGRIIYRSNGTYFAETYIKDHLGNIRIAYVMKYQEVNRHSTVSDRLMPITRLE